MDVRVWPDRLGLGQYADRFVANYIDATLLADVVDGRTTSAVQAELSQLAERTARRLPAACPGDGGGRTARGAGLTAGSGACERAGQHPHASGRAK
ncbi:MAG: hypothetical protein JSR91_23030 [Proteobacteria bacterium]|nr:hypothetical protein [Pseudomonadota bacterium]